MSVDQPDFTQSSFNTYSPIAYGNLTVQPGSPSTLTLSNIPPGMYTIVFYIPAQVKVDIVFTGVAYGYQSQVSEGLKSYITAATFAVVGSGTVGISLIVYGNLGFTTVYLIYQTVPVTLGLPICPAIPTSSPAQSPDGYKVITLSSVGTYVYASTMFSGRPNYYRVINGFIANVTGVSSTVKMVYSNLVYSFSVNASQSVWIGQYVQGIYSPDNDIQFYISTGSAPIYVYLNVEEH
jgi:hypothetical protein